MQRYATLLATQLTELEREYLHKRIEEERAEVASLEFARAAEAAQAKETVRDFKEYLERHLMEPGRNTLVGRTTLEGRTVHIPDVRADPEYTWNEAIERGGFRTSLGIPFYPRGRANWRIPDAAGHRPGRFQTSRSS